MPVPRPNILLITAHDLGKALGCHGARGVRTPNLDQLAAEGVVFERAFCTAPQCSPSRASLYTGRYPQTNGVLGLTHAQFGWDLNPGEVHLASFLRDHGWDTALIGIQHETRHPERMRFTHLDERTGRTGCMDIADLARQWIEGRDTSHQPFYLQLGFFEPHRAPWMPDGFPEGDPADPETLDIPGYLKDTPQAREDVLAFNGAVNRLDRAVGSVLDALSDGGLRDNTLVLFTADHGAPFPGAKCTLFDPGIEVPLLMRWPQGGIDGGRRIGGLASLVDVAPTLVDLLDLPPELPFQGRSLAGLLAGQGEAVREEVFAQITYHNYYEPLRAIRTATHKLIVAFAANPSFMDPAQGNGHKLFHRSMSREQTHDLVRLYDLREDPGETRNLADSPSHDKLRTHLLGQLRDWMERVGDPLLHGVPPSPMHLRAIAALGAETPLSDKASTR